MNAMFERADRVPILYLAPWVDLGGSDKGTIDWFRHLDRSQWAPSLITTQPSANRWLHHVEPYAEELWALPDIMSGADFPGFILGFIESRSVKVVHIMNSRIGYDLMPDMTCLQDPPAIVLQHHAEEPDRSGYVRYAATRYGNLVDAFSVTSEQLGRALHDYDVPGSRIHVIHSGVDADTEFDPDLVTPYDDLPGSGPRVLWPGRLAEQKDPMLTLEVLRLLRERGVELVLHIVGDGPLLPAVREGATRLGLDSMVAWHPPSQEMARWYRSCDLLLMTSVFEGVPYVVYEALAMGVPVVAPALPGNVEFMDNDAGILVKPRDDAEQYARALAQLLDDVELRQSMGARSRERMQRDFSLNTMAKRHEELYAQLLAHRSPADRARRRAIEDSAPKAAAPREPLRLVRDPRPAQSVAVIVPCYQHGRYLADCIASIRAQTLPAEQVIVVDDNSNDPETEAALDALGNEPDVMVIRQAENRGPSAARNRAVREVTAQYVLPLDADDLLMPDALARMVTQLECATSDVGFIYPNPLHFGNRHDFVQSPAYNLHLLLQGNYCPSTSLIDRRVFDAGARYDEEIVFGHEDWDFILQLAEMEVWGGPAEGATFLYRRRGFSRVNAVEYGPTAFHDIIERRHPALYAPAARERIKAQWAPALSILLVDEEGLYWSDMAVADLGGQSCSDFEVLTSRAAGVPGVQAVTVVPSCEDARVWLANAVDRARGRWILVAAPLAAPVFERRWCLEHLLRALWHGSDRVLALAEPRDHPHPSLTRVPGPGARSPVGVMWERRPDAASVEVEIGYNRSVVEDLVMALQHIAPIQWRLMPFPMATRELERSMW